jgi:hypothetical protein
MKEFAIGSYRDPAGSEHELIVRASADGGWEVLDLDAEDETTQIVETLTGPEDGRPQAEAIARDYLTNLDGSPERAGHEPAEAISEHGGRDVHSHRRPPTGSRKPPARRVALPDPAR